MLGCDRPQNDHGHVRPYQARVTHAGPSGGFPKIALSSSALLPGRNSAKTRPVGVQKKPCAVRQ